MDSRLPWLPVWNLPELQKLYESTGRAAEACAILTPALDGFSPTAEMPEINEAQALLELWTHGA